MTDLTQAEKGALQLVRKDENTESQGELLPAPPHNQLALGSLTFETDDELIQAAAAKARSMRKMIEAADLVQRIGQSDHVKVAGWVMLAKLCCVQPILEGKPELQEDGSWMARALLLSSDGRTLHRAVAYCGDKSDGRWANAPKFQKVSMAQTRAIGKVCRLALSDVMALGGYEETPAEEMTGPGAPKIDPNAEKRAAAIIDHAESIRVIKDALITGEFDKAAEAYDELGDEIMMLLWHGTPRSGGVFTSAEKKAMRSEEFNSHRPKTIEIRARQQAEAEAFDRELGDYGSETKCIFTAKSFCRTPTTLKTLCGKSWHLSVSIITTTSIGMVVATHFGITGY